MVSVGECFRVFWTTGGLTLPLVTSSTMMLLCSVCEQNHPKQKHPQKTSTLRIADALNPSLLTGYAIEASNTGLIEDVRMGLERGITSMINFFRTCIRKLFRLPPKQPSHGMEERPSLTRRNTAPLPVSLPALFPWSKNSQLQLDFRNLSHWHTLFRSWSFDCSQIRRNTCTAILHSLVSAYPFVMYLDQFIQQGGQYCN